MWPFRKRQPEPTHDHRWVVVSVSVTQPRAPGRWGSQEYSEGSSSLAMRCSSCGGIQNKTIPGMHPNLLKQVMGAEREALR